MKTNSKRLLSALLAMVMVLSMLVIPAGAAEGDMTGAVGDKWVFVADAVDTEVTEGWGSDYQFDSMTGPMNFKGLQLLAARSGYYNGYLYPEKGVDIPVAGKCQVEVTCTANADGTLSVGDSDENAVKLEKDGTAVYSYAADEAGTVTLKQKSYTCVTKIKITAYSEKPTMKLDKDSVVIKMSETAQVTPTITNGTAEAYTFEYTEAGIVTATEADGAITLTPAAAGKTTVTVKTTVGETELAKTIAVRVLPEDPGTVSENQEIAFRGKTGANQEDLIYSPGLEWLTTMDSTNGEGPNAKNPELNVYIPEGKQTTLTIDLCGYVGGQAATLTANGETITPTDGEMSENGKNKIFTIEGATGKVELAFTSSGGAVFIHKLTVGEFTDATKEFEAKTWEFANDTFDPATTYEDLTITGGKATGADHGMAFFGDGSIVLPVNGPCDIVVTGSHAWDISLNGSKLEHEKTASEGQAAAAMTFYYTGNAGTATLNCGARTWIKSIELQEATPAADIPAKLAVEKTSVSLKLGSSITSKTEVAVYLRNAKAADVAVSVDKEDVATATYADGKVTLQGKAEGEATVTLTLKGEEAATVKVTVAGAGDQTVAEGEYILTDTSNPDRLTVPGIDFGNFVIISNNHGAINQGEAVLTFNLARAADIQIMTCPFGTGQFLDVKASSGVVTMEKINSCGATDTEHYQDQDDVLGAKISIVGAQKGKLTVTLTPTEGGAGNFDYDLGSGIGKLNPDQIWMKNVSVTYYADLSGDRNIDVWDLSGQAYAENEFKFAEDKVVDNITPELWVSSGALASAQFAKAEATSFGDMDLIHNANDRIYSSVEGNADFIKLLGGNATTSYNQTFEDGFNSTGGFYANGTGSAANRSVTFKRVAAGDKIIAYVGSSQNGDVSIHFQGQGSAAGQEDVSDLIEVKTYQRLEFVAEKEGNYKLWGGQPGSGKPFYIRFIRVPAVAVSGTITLPEGFTATDYQVKFTNKTTKKATLATVGGDGTFTAALAAGYEYTAMLTGVPGFGFTVASKNVTTSNVEALSGKANVELVVEPKETYTFSGKFTGFASGYDTSKLAVTLIPEEGSGSDEVALEITGLDFTAKLDPGVAYTLELSGVNDYVIDAPLTVNSEKDDVKQDIAMKAKDLHTASGKFLGLGKDGKVTALVFENVEDKYTYTATVTADGYTAQLRDGAYSTKATVEGKYSTITHVVVDGKDVEKDLLFVSTGDKPPVAKVKDVYVGYAGKSPNFDTVTEALDAISCMGIAAEADRVTVHIAPGTYREQLTVKTPYVTFINDEPDKGEVLLTWYYGIGYMYYSSNGYYDAQRAYDKFEKKIADRWGCAVRVTGKGFRAENITFENSFNRYITEEEILDGAEPAGNEAINLARNYSTDVTTLAATERAAAICVEADECEFYKCKFYSSQDTVYTQGKIYFKNCLLEGMTDYIFGDFASKCIFDACQLSWKGYKGSGKPGYVTAVRTQKGEVGYLFRNCTVTGNPKLTVEAGYFGRPWAADASAKFINTKLEKAGLITAEAWATMNNDQPENAQFGEYNTTTVDGAAVDTSKRVANTLMTAAQVAEQTRDKYFGAWVPYYYVEEAATVAFEVAPTITDNGDINTPYPGHTLTVNYSLGEANDANDASIIQWSRVADDGTETVVKTTTAAVGKTYQITKADQGAKIKVTVTPTTVSGKTGAAKSITMENKVREGFEDPTGATDPELGDGVNVFLAGDSTVFDYSNGRDEGSWGEFLQNYLDKDKVTVVDHAVGGRSSRSFINEGRLDAIAKDIKEGDFLLIQFGHNDCANETDYRVERYAPLGNADASGVYPTTAGTKGSDGKYTWDCGGTYKWYLQQYIDVAKKAGATPILVTPVARLYYNADGTIRPHHDASYATNGSVTDTSKWDTTKDTTKCSNTYVTAVKQLAQENGIACIDAFQFTKDMYDAAYKACPDSDKATYGRQVMHAADSTHSNKLGGMIQAAMIARAIKDLDVSISKTVKAPTMAQADTTKGKTVFTVDGKGVFTAYDMLKDYAETAPYWMGIGQELMDALKGASSDEPADKAALTKAITAAEKAVPANIYVVGDDTKVSDVNKGTKFMTETDKAAYDAALANAKAVLAKTSATQAEVDAAVKALDAAAKAVKTGTKGGGSTPSSSRPSGNRTDTTTTVTNPNGSVATTTTKANGDKTIVVKSEDGEVLAEVKLPATIAAPATKFVDVPEGHWAEQSINNMAGLGMVKGVGENTYDMASPMTRASIATIFFRLSNGKEGKTTTFADVATDVWYADAIGWAANSGVVNGYSETAFGPDDTITRQQLAVMIARYARLLGLDTTAEQTALAAFADGSAADSWATDSLAWCVKTGVMKGRGGNVLDPTAAVTRAEAAVMIDRMIGLIK